MKITLKEFYQTWQVGSDLKSNYIRAKVYEFQFNTSKLEELTTFPSDSGLFVMQPQADYFARVVEFVSVQITNNPISAINLTILLSFGLTGGMAYFCLKSLKVNSVLSFIVSISISQLPYHYVNVRYGFSNLNYSSIILTIYIMNKLSIEKFNIKSVKNLFALLLSALYLSSTNTYYVYFSLVLFIAFNLLTIFSKYRKNFFLKFYFITLTLAGVFLQYLIDIKYFGYRPLNNLRTADRMPADLSSFGTHFWSFVTPNPFSNIEIVKIISNSLFQSFWDEFFLTKINVNDNNIYQSWLSSSDIERISLTPLTALISILLIIIYFVIMKLKKPINSNNLLHINLWILLGSFLLASKGLILTNLSMVFPIFRSYSRSNILVLISLLLVLAVMINNLKIIYRVLIQILLIIVIFFDQVMPNFSPINYNYHLDTNHKNIGNFLEKKLQRDQEYLYAATLPVQSDEELKDLNKLKIQTRLLVFYLYSNKIVIPMNVVEPKNTKLISKFQDLRFMNEKGIFDFTNYVQEQGYDLIIYDATAYEEKENLYNLKILRNLSSREIDANYKKDLKIFLLD